MNYSNGLCGEILQDNLDSYADVAPKFNNMNWFMKKQISIRVPFCTSMARLN